MKAIKLVAMRIIFTVVMRIAWAVTRRERFLWLAYYLEGSGTLLGVPAHVVQAIQKTLAGLWMEGEAIDHRSVCSDGPVDAALVCLGHSTLYEGSGFEGRPEAFYVVGGFTYHVVANYLVGTVTVNGFDEYDWHPQVTEEFDDESLSWVTREFWFTSPVPAKLHVAARIAAKVFGNEYFVHDVRYDGAVSWGVSNRLWADLVQVGAKPFTSVIHHSWSLQEWRRLAGCTSRADWWKEAGW